MSGMLHIEFCSRLLVESPGRKRGQEGERMPGQAYAGAKLFRVIAMHGRADLFFRGRRIKGGKAGVWGRHGEAEVQLQMADCDVRCDAWGRGKDMQYVVRCWVGGSLFGNLLAAPRWRAYHRCEIRFALTRTAKGCFLRGRWKGLRCTDAHQNVFDDTLTNVADPPECPRLVVSNGLLPWEPNRRG